MSLWTYTTPPPCRHERSFEDIISEKRLIKKRGFHSTLNYYLMTGLSLKKADTGRSVVLSQDNRQSYLRFMTFSCMIFPAIFY